jgi:uncharacterized repeat protein (TIGR01451 family)/LPXTG-motif cell wall-anchored protein
VGAVVELLDSTGTTVIATQSTDSAGYYRFDGLFPATYVVRVAASNFTGDGPLVGYQSSTATAGAFDTSTNNDDHGINDTNAANNGIVSAPVTITTEPPVGDVDADAVDAGGNGPLGDTYDMLTADFGFTRLVAVGDYTWVDTNRNGVQDAGEPPIAGVTVTLSNSDGTPATDSDGVLVPPVTSDSNGHYVFDNLLPGDYTVNFSLPDNYLYTTTGAGTSATDSNADTTTGSSAVFTVAATPTGDTRAVMAGDGTAVAAFINPTIDAGFVLRQFDLVLNKTFGSIDTNQLMITWNVSVVNNGPDAAPGPITVTDTLPAELSFVSGGGTTAPCTAVAQTVTCVVTGSLGVGSTIAFQIVTGYAGDPSGIINGASVEAAVPGDSNVPDNESSAPVPPQSQSLPATGRNVDGPLLAGTLSILLGGLALLAGRRRRRSIV